MPRVAAGWLDALPVNRPVLVVLDDRRIVLVRQGDTVHAVDDACPHAGGPLSEGAVLEDMIICPYHTWMWDLTTGVCRVPGRSMRLPVYRTAVEDGRVWVDL